ncbi:unnamed protein product [Lota lota]
MPRSAIWPAITLSLLWGFTQTPETQTSWALELDPYDWMIVHKSGAQHTNADALSRRADTYAVQMEFGCPWCHPNSGEHGYSNGYGPQTPVLVCAVDTPTTTPATGLSSGPHSPSDLQAPTDQTLIYTLSHNGSSYMHGKEARTPVNAVLGLLVQGDPEDSASPGSTVGSSGSNMAMDFDLKPDADSVDSPEHALAPTVFSLAGRSARRPVRIVNYVMG